MIQKRDFIAGFLLATLLIYIGLSGRVAKQTRKYRSVINSKRLHVGVKSSGSVEKPEPAQVALLHHEAEERSDEPLPELLTAENMTRICSTANETLWCSKLLKMLQPYEFNTCKPKKSRKVSFLKTHKTGSSTVASIMYRYSEHNDLRGMLPKPYMNPYSYAMQYPWDRRYRENALYEFFAFHIHHYNIPRIQHLLGKNSNFVTILREPAKNFESSYSYFGRERYYHMNAKEYLQRRLKSWYRGTNPQIKDLGLSSTLLSNAQAVERYIRELSAHFDLVMINEAFDESAILLANLGRNDICACKSARLECVLPLFQLCLPLRNVTYLNQKQRVDQNRIYLNDSDKAIARKHFDVDYLLYDHFTNIHKERVKAFGLERMRRFSEQLHEMNKYVGMKCGVDTTRTRKKEGKSRESITNKVVLTNDTDDHDCFLTAMIERKYKKRLVGIEAARWRAEHPHLVKVKAQ